MATARAFRSGNICIYIRRRRPPAVFARFRQLLPREAVLSVITHRELVDGAESQFGERAKRQPAELAGLPGVMSLPPRVAERYGRAGAEGQMIGNTDLWITAHARAAGLILATNNERKSRRIEELEIPELRGLTETAGVPRFSSLHRLMS
jgi:tRNA(fMet)-specific endonuclease VapC